jgi:hypothetical protein
MSVVLHEFDVYHIGVSRAEAAEFLANGTGIVSIIELLLALTIGGPPGIAAGIPASDPRISSGSKCDAVWHYAFPSLAFETGECACLVLANFQHWPIPNRRHRTRSKPKKDTASRGVAPEREGGAGYREIGAGSGRGCWRWTPIVRQPEPLLKV